MFKTGIIVLILIQYYYYYYQMKSAKDLLVETALMKRVKQLGGI